MKQSLLDRMLNLLSKVLNLIISILLSLMVIIVFSNVIGRYFLHSALAWSEEISRFLFIWMVLFGSILAYVNDEHLGLDLLVRSLPVKAAQGVAVIADILILYAISLITAGGYRMTVESWTWLSPAASVPYGYVYVVVPFCGGILFIQTMLKTIKHVKVLVGSKESNALSLGEFSKSPGTSR